MTALYRRFKNGINSQARFSGYAEVILRKMNMMFDGIRLPITGSKSTLSACKRLIRMKITDNHEPAGLQYTPDFCECESQTGYMTECQPANDNVYP